MYWESKSAHGMKCYSVALGMYYGPFTLAIHIPGISFLSDQCQVGEPHYTVHKLIKVASGYLERESVSASWLHFDTSNFYFQYTMNAIPIA